MTYLNLAGSTDHTSALSAQPARPRRYTIDATARLRIGSHLVQVRTLDISEGGAKLLLDQDFQREILSFSTLVAAGTLVLVNTACLGAPRLASIIWQQDDKIGLQFREPLSLTELECLHLREQAALETSNS